MSELVVRRATPEDASVLQRIAYASKRHWGYPDEYMALWKHDLTVTPAFVDEHPVYCAVEDATIAGFYALSSEGSVWELEHMWVDPPHMRRGIGARLFRHAVETARAAGATVLEIVSDPNAERFYLCMGARRVGEVASRPTGRMLPVLELALLSCRAAPC
jgi:GNAT superfamily N-acetyltransferase